MAKPTYANSSKLDDQLGGRRTENTESPAWIFQAGCLFRIVVDPQPGSARVRSLDRA